MKCPKCGVDSLSNVECSKCGIIFAKYSAHAPANSPAAKPPAAEPPSANPALVIVPQAKKSNFRAISLFLALVLLVGVVVYKASFEESAGPGRDETAQMNSGRRAGLDRQSESSGLAGPSRGRTPLNQANRVSGNRQWKNTAPAPRRRLPILPTFLGWKKGAPAYQSALATQGKSGAPVLLYVGVEWCGFCKQFDASIAPVREVRDALKTAIKVKIKPDKNDADKALAKQLGVTSYPTLLLITSPKAKPTRLRSGVRRGNNPKPKELVNSYQEQVKRDWHQMAFKAYKSRQFDQAISMADRAFVIDNRDPGGRLYSLRASAFHSQGQMAEAVRDTIRACELGNKGACTSIGR